MPLVGDLAYNPGMWPDWELNRRLWFAGNCSVHWATPARVKPAIFIQLSSFVLFALLFENNYFTLGHNHSLPLTKCISFSHTFFYQAHILYFLYTMIFSHCNILIRLYHKNSNILVLVYLFQNLWWVPKPMSTGAWNIFSHRAALWLIQVLASAMSPEQVLSACDQYSVWWVLKLMSTKIWVYLDLNSRI